jgi:isopenicillin-N epimerase
VCTSFVGCAYYYKWLCAPKGAGFLYARPEVQSLLKPWIVSSGYESITPSGSNFIDHHEWWGTRDMAAFLSVPKAIEFQRENHWDEVRDSCHRLVLYAQKRICELTGLAPLHPQTDTLRSNSGQAWFRQMAAAPLPADTDIILLKKRLYDDYRVEIPVLEWFPSPKLGEGSGVRAGNKLIRISVQGYNTRRDIDRLIRALSILLK